MIKTRVALTAVAVLLAAGANACSSTSNPQAAGAAPTITVSPALSPTAAALPASPATRPATVATSGPASAKPSAAGSSAAQARAGAPTRTFAVATLDLALSRGADRPLPTHVWYPKDGAGPFPVILWSHGIHQSPETFGAMLSQWSAAGFIVAAPAYPHTALGVAHFDLNDILNQPADASKVLDGVLALNDRPGPLRGRINTKKIGAAGHSGGGITTVHLFSVNRDPRLVAGVVEAGMQMRKGPFTGPAATMLFVHGALDGAVPNESVPYQDGLDAYNAVPWKKAMITLPNAGHQIVTLPGIPVAALDFWRWTLYGDTAAKARIGTDAAGYKYDNRLG